MWDAELCPVCGSRLYSHPDTDQIRYCPECDYEEGGDEVSIRDEAVNENQYD